MSYDVSLLFHHPQFPLEEWKVTLNQFNLEEREVQRSRYNQSTVCEWLVTHKECTLGLELRDLNLIASPQSRDFRWEISIQGQQNRPENAFFLFAVPNHALLLMENVTFYDPQANVFIEKLSEYHSFVDSQLAKFGISKMFKLGLMSADGKTLF